MKVKILFIIPSFRTGGVERVTLNIINSLDFLRFEVYLIILEKGNNGLLSYLNANINIVELDKGSLRNSVFAIYKELRKIKPAILFTSFNHLSLFSGLLKAFCFFNFKTIVRLNSLPSNKLTSNWRDKVYNLLFRRIVCKSDVVISQSKEMTDEIIEFFNIDLNRVKTIRNPIDKELILDMSLADCGLSFDKIFFNLVAIGSLSEVKGFDLLIEAMHNLQAKGNYNYRLYIIGENREIKEDYSSVLKKLINRFKLDDYVFLLGYQANPYCFLKKADAFVLSSRKEGFPNVVLEALVLQKPCLVTNCIDLSDVVFGDRGIIVEKNSIEDLERGLILLQKYSGTSSEFVNYNFNKLFIDLIDN